jgi:RND family efflux transporter MFP subunit
MATQGSSSVDISGRLLITLLREREVQPRALLIAQAALELFPGAAAVVYVVEAPDDPKWTSKAIVGDIHLDEQVIAIDAGTLGTLADNPQPIIFAGSKLNREDYAHLHSRRTVQSLAYVPLLADGTLIGALEVIALEAETTEEDLASLIELSESSAAALAAALDYERERNSQLSSISRLAQLYDLEKVFNSTPEMDDLLPIVARKFREVLNVQAVNLWLVGGEGELVLLNRDGEDPTVEVGAVQRSGEGIVSEVSDSGEPLILSDAEDERLKKRNAAVEDGAVFSLVAVPIVAQEKQVGIVEAINKLDGNLFDDDDLFLLTSVAETAANALHNASLLQAERKVEILETLVTVSKEITSTLNMDGVLHTVVNGTKAVVPYDRAAVALEQRGKLQVKAVSGLEAIRLGDAEVQKLRALLEWATVSNDEIHIKQYGDEVEADREETKAKFAEYFQQTEMRAFYALPLLDDAGRIGILSFESRDPDFLTDAHVEMIRVLAAQVTVALRNAELYKEVPFIGVIEPLMQRKKRFMAMEKRRRALFLTVAAAVALFLIFCPIPMRLAGDASVAPQNIAQIQPEFDGVVRSVAVHEGDAVKKGTVLAELDDWEYRSALAAVQAKYSSALAEMNRALATNDGTEAGVQRIQADYWSSEVERARERLDKTRMRSPIDGLVSTPHVETFVGRRLEKGDVFAEVINTSGAMVDVAIDQEEVRFLKPGEESAVKLESFPTRTFKGTVTIVSPKSVSNGDDRVFFARVSVPNPDGKIRPGMQGRGKVWAGWRPAGYVLLRRPLVWIWSKLWSWFGW